VLDKYNARMFFNKIAAALKIRSGEARLVLLVAGLFATIELGRGIGGSAADALFFLRFGVDYLPYLYIALGVTNFIVTLSYAAFLGRFNHGRFFSTLLLVFALILLSEWAAIHLEIRALYPVLWLSVNIISALLGTLAWTTASEVCDPRQAKRLFPIFVSAGILGGLLGSVITGPAAALLGTENLMVIFAVLLLAGLLFIRTIAARFFHPATTQDHSNFLVDVRAGFDVVRRSPMLQLLAAAAVLFSILYFSISFPFGRAVSASFSSEAEVAGFLGAFSGIASVVTFVAALLIANRLYSRIGVVNSLLILPITYLFGFVLFAVNFSLTTAVIVRLSQLVVLSGIGDGAYGTFFNVVPPAKRAQVRAFDSGVPSQIGIILSGILLLLGERLLTNTQIFVMGMVVALACTYVIWRMRRSYADALIAALRAGRVEVFADGDQAFASLHDEAGAIRIAVDALRDPKPILRRLAAEMLTRMGATSAGPALIQTLNDSDVQVRSAAIHALGELKINEARQPLLSSLGDADPSVRKAALIALPKLLQINGAIPIEIERLLNDPELSVRVEAAVAVAHLGHAEKAFPTLTSLLNHDDPDMRVLAINSLSQIFTGTKDSPSSTSSPSLLAERGAGGEVNHVIATLDDPLPIVRRAAATALGNIRHDDGLQPLVQHLTDPDQTVRFAAASALQQFGQKATPFIMEVLQKGHVTAYDAALAALSLEETNTLETLRTFARQEMTRLHEWRQLSAAVPTAGHVTAFLRDILARNATQSEQRLVRIIGLLTRKTAMETVGRALKEHDADMRASAVEALDTLGDKQLTREVLPLLENAASPDLQNAPLDSTFTTLLQHEDHWLRALGAFATGELSLKDRIPELQTLAKDSDPLISDGASRALSQLGEPMETLQTLSLMERIMLLREVPLFANLSPDDLKQIAEIAWEDWYHDGAILFKVGDEGHELFIIATGKMKVIKDADSAPKVLAVRGPGEFIGEMAIIESAQRSATVQVEGEARALVIDENAFKAILRDRPEVALAVLRALSRRLREMS
jgi:HEAT repeat protein